MTTPLNSPHEALKQSSPVNADEPLSIDRPGDALALVHHTFGELPQDSLVVVGMSAGTTGGHLRMDLAPVLHEPSRGVALAASWLAGEEAAPAPEAAFAMVFGANADRESGAEHAGAEIPALMRLLRSVLGEHYSVPLVKAWHIDGDAIRDADCTDPLCCPYPGVPVDSAIRETWQRCPEISSDVNERPLSAEIQRFLREAPPAHLRTPLAPYPTGEMPSAAVALSLWDMAISSCIESGNTSWALQEDRRLVMTASVALPGFIESLMVCAASDVDTAHAGHSPLAATGRGTAQNDSPSRDYRAVLMGCTACAPDWQRIDAMDQLLWALAPHAENHLADLLSCKAWVEWAKGRGSAADEALKYAYIEDPAHTSARFFQALFEVTGPCPWARVKRDSYGWWTSAGQMIR